MTQFRLHIRAPRRRLSNVFTERLPPLLPFHEYIGHVVAPRRLVDAWVSRSLLGTRHHSPVLEGDAGRYPDAIRLSIATSGIHQRQVSLQGEDGYSVRDVRSDAGQGSKIAGLKGDSVTPL